MWIANHNKLEVSRVNEFRVHILDNEQTEVSFITVSLVIILNHNLPCDFVVNEDVVTYDYFDIFSPTLNAAMPA